jgi:hypothetical protein
MASFTNPKPKRVAQLSVFADGTWKVITDMTPAEAHPVLDKVVDEIADLAARVAAGESQDEPDDDDSEG